MNRLLITRWEGRILTALWDGERVRELNMEREGEGIRVGDIYLGRIQRIAKNIHAAFVEIRSGSLCFFPLPKTGISYREGDEFPVQVSREAVKTKEPVVTDRISLGGRTLVLLTDRVGTAVSAKIRDRKRREELQDLLNQVCRQEKVGFILRTNAASAPDGDILREADVLVRRLRDIQQKARSRSVFTCLRRGLPAYLSAIFDAREGSLDSVVTDDPEIYTSLCSELEGPDALFCAPPLTLYRDPALSLRNLYRLDHFLHQALNRRVWLKSGGYLVIEITEALTVIDVNTGKVSSRGGREETFRKINEEAAREIAFQMRLRNLSGIILIDFIDMEREEDRRELMEILQEAIAQDPTKTVLVDVTALNLAELTRRKTRKTLEEQVNS